MKDNPFYTRTALCNSSLHFVQQSNLVPFVATARVDPFLFKAHEQFRALVMRPEFSCLGAKAAFHDEAYGFGIYKELGSAKSTAGLCFDLFNFLQQQDTLRHQYATFVAVFRKPLGLNETQFERQLWKQLQKLHRADASWFNWDPDVSSDPEDPYFSFSFAGQAFYIVGMHGNSSRLARRFPWPALVFNPHEQFEQLRADGKWKRMQQTIRSREFALQGSVNPMLTEFGEESEARQYSGRAVPDDWRVPLRRSDKCPFAH
jgi:uncharacterized protein